MKPARFAMMFLLTAITIITLAQTGITTKQKEDQMNNRTTTNKEIIRKQPWNVLPADLLSLQRKANPKKVIFIDRFIVPAPAVREFKERVRVNRTLIKTLPGFIGDAAYESAEKEGSIKFVTIAEWESEEAIRKAKEAVQAAYKKDGFDLQAMLKRLNISIDRGLYQPATDH